MARERIPAGIVADANVLIDYRDTDKSILRVVSRQWAPLYVPSPVLEEVLKLPPEHARAMGIENLEPTFDEADEAARRRDAGTSFNDRLCLIVARNRGWVVLTNDRKLRQACRMENIGVVWGFEVMLPVVASGHLTVERALGAATRIIEINPRMRPEILERFRKRLGV